MNSPMNQSSLCPRISPVIVDREFDPVRAWQRVALQAAKEGNPDKLVEFSRELQRKLNGENGAPRRPSAKRKSTNLLVN
ncbi:MAG: hypothetical protein DMG96_12350 [Acidobacteria bacterium]|nr:MAG: hypothetical protein DMG96_12350 [Acidobacteriota bacterium]